MVIILKRLITPFENNKTKKLKNIISSISILKKVARRLLNLKSRFFSKTYELYWEPNFIPLNSIKAKKVVTSVHDFSFELYKEFHPKERIEYLKKIFIKIFIEVIILSVFQNLQNEKY